MRTNTLLIALAFCLASTSAVTTASTKHPTPKPSVVPTAAPTPTATPANYVTVPGGTSVAVNLVDKISSGTANVGDTFAIVAAQDVVVDGWVVIAKGAAGQGEVLSVDRAGSNGHAGSLGIQMDWIFAADGEKVKLTSQKATQEGEGKAGAASTMTIVSWAFLGLPGLFAHNFVKGRNIDIDSTKQFEAFVDETVHVSAIAPATPAPGFAH